MICFNLILYLNFKDLMVCLWFWGIVEVLVVSIIFSL